MAVELSNFSYWDIIESDPELQAQLMEYPRLADNLKILPHKQGVCIIGGCITEIFNGFGVRQRFSQLLPLLDGTRTLEQIVQQSENLEAYYVKEVIANLFIAGLLRDSVLDEELSIEGKYFERLCGYTGIVSSGKASIARLCNASLAIFGPDNLVDQVMIQYESIGSSYGKRCVQISLAGEIPKGCNFLLVIKTSNELDPERLFEEANEKDIPALNVEISNDRARIGPYILPKRSASYSCYRLAYEPLPPSNDLFSEQFWAAYALHITISTIAGLCKQPIINSFNDYEWKRNRQIHKRTSVARLHGWDSNGKSFPLNLTKDSKGYEAWKHYCGVALQSLDYAAPNSYHAHYKPENIQAQYQRPHAIYSGKSIRIPDLTTFSGDIDTNKLTFRNLAPLVHYSAGYGVRENIPRRYAPTGGNLGSSYLMLLALNVEGLERRVYWFDCNSNCLEYIEAVNVDMVLNTLEIHSPPGALLLSFADTAKIARKYGAFSFNVSWYDAGVLLSYMNNLAETQNFSMTDYISFDNAALQKVLKISSSNMIVTGVIGIDKKDEKPGDASHRRLDHHGSCYSDLVSLIKARKAERAWISDDITTSQAQNFSAAACKTLANFKRVFLPGIDVSILMVLKLSDGIDGVYTINGGSELNLLQEYPRDLHKRILSQLKLTESPIIMLPKINLGQLLKAFGDRALEIAYRVCAAIIGDLWLHSDLWQMAGTACGGCYEGEVRSIVKEHGLSHFTPLAFCLGPVKS